MKNLPVWIVLICTATFGVAVAQPNMELALDTQVAVVTTA
jgi:hypothetical protein